MLLFRMGPRYLFLRTESIDELADFLVDILDGEITDFDGGTSKAADYSTLCFLTGINKEKTLVEDAEKIVFINTGSSVILSRIMNNNGAHLINKVDFGPTAILVRIPGNEDHLIEKFNSIFHGEEVNWRDAISLGEKDDTIIAFTDRVLTGPVSDFLGSNLLIHEPARTIQDKLRLEGLRFITQSLDDSQWYELRINIYDSYGKYEDHYNRLMFVLSKLEVGMILGESWTKDYAVMLYSVMTYQVRLFTFYKPAEVKKILLGLEYTIDGERLVDYDIYNKNKKISWAAVVDSKAKRTKIEEAKRCRLDMYKKLSQEDIDRLEEMERTLPRKWGIKPGN